MSDFCQLKKIYLAFIASVSFVKIIKVKTRMQCQLYMYIDPIRIWTVISNPAEYIWTDGISDSRHSCRFGWHQTGACQINLWFEI